MSYTIGIAHVVVPKPSQLEKIDICTDTQSPIDKSTSRNQAEESVNFVEAELNPPAVTKQKIVKNTKVDQYSLQNSIKMIKNQSHIDDSTVQCFIQIDEKNSPEILKTHVPSEPCEVILYKPLQKQASVSDIVMHNDFSSHKPNTSIQQDQIDQLEVTPATETNQYETCSEDGKIPSNSLSPRQSTTKTLQPPIEPNRIMTTHSPPIHQHPRRDHTKPSRPNNISQHQVIYHPRSLNKVG